MKLTLNDKLQIIKLYKEGYSANKIAIRYKVLKITIERIERQYREHGIESSKKKEFSKVCLTKVVVMIIV